jgi:hypothetical protein
MSSVDHFRAHARRLVALDGVLFGEDEPWERPARVIDLGLGGARLKVVEGVTLGTSVRLAVLAPHLWDPLELCGEVVWVAMQQGKGDTRVGMRFNHRSGATLRALVELLEANVYR